MRQFGLLRVRAGLALDGGVRYLFVARRGHEIRATAPADDDLDLAAPKTASIVDRLAAHAATMQLPRFERLHRYSVA